MDSSDTWGIVVLFGAVIIVLVLVTGIGKSKATQYFNSAVVVVESKSAILINKWTDSGKVDIAEKQKLIDKVQEFGVICTIITDIDTKNKEQSTMVTKLEGHPSFGPRFKKTISVKYNK